jgi:helix-turn-helix protein
MSKVVEEKPDMPTPEAADYIGNAPSTLKTWRCHGKGPAYYRGLGKEILYRKVDLDAFIRSRRIVPDERTGAA